MIRWDNSNYLMHYGTKGHSGRYPPGSGKNPKTGPRANQKANLVTDKKKKVIVGSEKLENKRLTIMSKWGDLVDSGRASQKQIDKEYNRYAKFVQEHYDKPFVLTNEERRSITRAWTKEDVARGYQHVTPDEEMAYKSAMRKVGKGNRTSRGWY